MEIGRVIAGMGCCSLVCPLCYERDSCSGCKSDGLSPSRRACPIRRCALDKGYAGCWECTDAPCDIGVFSGPQAVRLKAFTRFMRQYGPEKLIGHVLDNRRRSIVFGPGNPYDACQREEAVIELLLTGSVKESYDKE